MIRIYGFPLGPYDGFSFFIFLFFKSKTPSKTIINHERIHFFQQLELLFVIHWILYLLHYLILRIEVLRMKNKPANPHDWAYRHIVFEIEAYAMEKDLTYLKTRKPYAWLRYFQRSGNHS